jgi:hypothetical protein
LSPDVRACPGSPVEKEKMGPQEDRVSLTPGKIGRIAYRKAVGVPPERRPHLQGSAGSVPSGLHAPLGEIAQMSNVLNIVSLKTGA